MLTAVPVFQCGRMLTKIRYLFPIDSDNRMFKANQNKCHLTATVVRMSHDCGLKTIATLHVQPACVRSQLGITPAHRLSGV